MSLLTVFQTDRHECVADESGGKDKKRKRNEMKHSDTEMENTLNFKVCQIQRQCVCARVRVRLQEHDFFFCC